MCKEGADGHGPRREGRGLLTCFDLPLGTFSEKRVVRRKHIDAQEALFVCTDALFTQTPQLFAIVLFFLFVRLWQRRRHNLVTFGF